MSKLIFLLFIGLSSAAIFAQEPTLSEPYINRAPVFSEWVEAIQPSKASPPPGSTVSSSPKRRPKSITVTKADGTRREVYSWDDGQVSERWFYKDLMLFQQPGKSDVYIMNEFQIRNVPTSGGNNISQSDFPNLSWISKETFRGVEPVNKRPCLHFEKKVPKPGVVAKPPAPVETVVAHAWIDAETKLPVASDDGVSTTTYSFRDTPKTPLELPPQFAKALAEYK